MKQTYENRELVILDDGEEQIEDLFPNDPRIHYVFENIKRTTGAKRNRICQLAKGPIICHWDDDDWSAADRIQYQVGLLEKTSKPVTGFSDLLFWDCNEKKAKRFRSGVKRYVCGTTLCYTKEFWQQHQFADRQQSSDNDFVYPILNYIAASKESRHMVARIHKKHTSPKSGIRELIPIESIPAAFWDNEKLRLP